MRRSLRSAMLALLCAGVLAGCVQYKSARGVEAAWQANVMERMVRGKSTRADVLAALGPPSQVIALKDETVLYYLFEKAEGEGMLLIVYNRVDIATRYDRAIFFFDDRDVLTDFSTRIQPRDET